jgi:sec-independent protein translocase protein TatB
MKGAMEEIKTEILKEADNPISDIKKEIDQVRQSVADIHPMQEVKQPIEEVKKSLNTGVSDPLSVSGKESQALLEEDKKIDPLSDEHLGPVSR